MLQLIKRNKLFFFPYFLFLLVGAFFLFYYSKKDSFLLINQSHTVFFDHFFKYITFLGDGRFVLVITLLFLFIKYAQAIILATAYLISGLITQFLKKIIFHDHPRPIAFFKKEMIHLVDGVNTHSMHSFPSGHTTSVFCLCSILAFVAPRQYGILFFILAFLGGYSRVYLAQHFPEDVYVGSIIGVVISIFVFYFFTKKLESLDKEWPEKSLLRRD